MNLFSMAETYGVCARKMQDCQRLAHGFSKSFIDLMSSLTRVHEKEERMCVMQQYVAITSITYLQCMGKLPCSNFGVSLLQYMRIALFATLYFARENMLPLGFIILGWSVLSWLVSFSFVGLLLGAAFYIKTLFMLDQLFAIDYYCHVRLPKLVPQFGERSLDYLIKKTKMSRKERRRLIKIRNEVRTALQPQSAFGEIDPHLDKVLSRIEDLVSALIACSECSSNRGIAAILHLYLKTHLKNSSVSFILECLEKILAVDTEGVGLHPQFGEQVLPNMDAAGLIDALRMAQKNWKTLSNGPLMENVGKVVSLVVCAGLCDEADVTFNINGVKTFIGHSQKRHMTATSMVDYLLDTMVFFIEGGYRCFQEKSVLPILMSDSSMDAFFVEFAEIEHLSHLQIAGNLEQIAGITENDYDKRLSEMIEQCKLLVKTAQHGMDKIMFQRKYSELLQLRDKLHESRLSGGLREAPWGVGFWGTTGVGKSDIADLTMSLMLQFGGYDASPDRVCTLAEYDKYMSNYRSHINGVFMDDVGNTNPKFQNESPVARIITISNNTRAYANMAELELKGRVSIQPKVLVITKNPKDGGASIYSREPCSIIRRERFTVKLTPKPQYAERNMMSSKKVGLIYPDGTPPLAELWLFTVERVVPLPDGDGNPSKVTWETVLEKGSLDEMLTIFYDDFEQYDAAQKALVNRSKTRNADVKALMCPSCRRVNCRKRADGTCQSKPPLNPEPVVVETTPDEESVAGSVDSYTQRRAEVAAEEAGVPEPFYDATSEEIPDHVDVEPLHVQFGESVFYYGVVMFGRKFLDRCIDRIDGRVSRLIGKVWKDWTSFDSDVTLDLMDRDVLVPFLRWFYDSYWSWPLLLIPRRILDSHIFQKIFFRSTRGIILLRLRAISRIVGVVDFMLIASTLYAYGRISNAMFIPLLGSVLALVTISVVWVATKVNIMQQAAYTAVLAEQDMFKSTVRSYRKEIRNGLLLAGGVAAVMYAIMRYRHVFRSLVPQGNLNPKDVGDVEERDKERNIWMHASVEPMDVTDRNATMTLEQVENKIARNLVFIERFFMDGNVKKRNHFNGLFVKSNVALIPNHALKRLGACSEVRFIRQDPNSLGPNFSAFIQSDYAKHLVGTDLALVWIPNGGDWADITHLFPNGEPPACVTSMLYKDSDGGLHKSAQRVNKGSDIVVGRAPNEIRYRGANYTYPEGTFDGLCMATHIADSVTPTIVGFHLAGDGPRAALGYLSRDALNAGIAELAELQGVFPSTSTNTIPKEEYGVKFYTGSDVHFKSPVNYLEEGSHLRYYGNVIGRATPASGVRTSMMSDTVAEVMGVPNQWGPPKLKNVAAEDHYPFQKALHYGAQPGIGVPAQLLNYAIADYANGLIEHARTMSPFLSLVAPLGNDEIVKGKPGVRFIDRMKTSTSPGFPLSGPKSKYMIADPDDVDDLVDVDPMFWTRADEICACIRKGLRCCAIFKACLKDEVVSKDSDKVRVFQSAPLALQLLIRKYFLPVARVVSMLPLSSECAVGINSRSDEWEQLMSHIEKYGKDRILAGDYSKYDLRMPAQLTFSAFRVLIMIAEATGNYSEDDITIMEGIATEIAYPLMAWNGDLLQLHGSNPSGHNLTVYVNSIVNSLLFRCGFAHYYGTETDFRSVVALTTYGDDAKSSVKEGYDEFNHVSYAAFLDMYGMKFTMPDKESKPVPYMDTDDADFLKRNSTFIPELGYRIGRLDEDSIFKSLHCNVKSKSISDKEQCGAILDSALSEWFCYGRDKYEARRQQLLQVADELQLAPFSSLLSCDFDEMLERNKRD